MKITLLENLGVSQETIERLAAPVKAAGHEFTYYPERSADPSVLLERSKGQDVVIIANTPYPVSVIRELPELKFINVAFTGIDHIGLEACKENGIAVCNAAGYSDQAVAELAIGLTIGLYRKFAAADKNVRNGATSAGLVGLEIGGKTVGIIGTGRIGMLTAKLFLAFGAKVIAYSRTEKEEAKKLGIEYVSLEELMKRSDIVSVHTPNNASTRGLISREMIALMKKSAVLINCARGPIVDNAALAEALKNGSIAGAGIDVYDMEPPIPADYPLLDAPNTLLTPHVAFLTHESMARRAEIVFNNLLAWLNGEPQSICKF